MSGPPPLQSEGLGFTSLGQRPGFRATHPSFRALKGRDDTPLQGKI